MQKAHEIDLRSGQTAVGGQTESGSGQHNSAQQKEGIAIAIELVKKLKGAPGVNGVHLMAARQEEIVPRIVKEAGLPKPVFGDLPHADAAARGQRCKII